MSAHHTPQENAIQTTSLSRKEARLLCAALVAHIDEATPWRSNEIRLSDRLFTPWPASLLLLCGAALAVAVSTLLR